MIQYGYNILKDIFMELVLCTFQIQKNQLDKFKNLSKNLHKPRSQILRELIDKEIKKHDKNKN
jgi:hypothetical protein